MGTSYTSTLKLGKPASGDTGWGNTLNSEVTDMIEEAIAGKATINAWTDATNTHNLTTANGSTSESRAAILRLTDTTTDLSGAGNLVVPTASKLYTVMNETGQTITVKTSSGTGIAVPTAKICSVFCDGTNVVEGASYSAAMSAATINTTGLVTVHSLRGTDATTVTTIKDEDNMSSDSATALVTQQSVKAYGDTYNKMVYTTDRQGPWDQQSSLSGSQPPTLTLSSGTTTIGEPIFIGTSGVTTLQTLDLSIHASHKKTDSTGNSGWGIDIDKKSRSATGVSIGTVAVAEAQLNGSSSYWREIKISGDVTSKIDNFSSIATAADGTGAARVHGFWFDSTNNRTSIVYLSTSSKFTGTGSTVYLSDSAFTAVDSYVTAFSGALADSGVGANTSVIGRYFGSTSEYQEMDYRVPTITTRFTSVAAGTTEYRVRITAGISSATASVLIFAMQITRGYNT